MARIAITFADQPDGLVDIQVYLDDIVEGTPLTPAQKLAQVMLQAAGQAAPATIDFEAPKVY